MEQGNVGMSSAAGVYQSLVGFALVMIANFIVRKKDRKTHCSRRQDMKKTVSDEKRFIAIATVILVVISIVALFR